MHFHPGSANRRKFLGTLTFSTAALMTRGVFAEELSRTPTVEEGPFYPYKLPLDTDNDLLIVNDSITPAVGEIAHVSGRLLDSRGEPIRNAVVEIWQADHTGTYIQAHPSDATKYDSHFQGFGRFLTGSTGEYYFRTIKPVPYTGRPAAHIHFAVKTKGRDKWTTQLFVKDSPGNDRDGIYNRIPKKDRESVTVAFAALKDSRIGEVAAKFDIVLGFTPQA